MSENLCRAPSRHTFYTDLTDSIRLKHCLSCVCFALNENWVTELRVRCYTCSRVVCSAAIIIEQERWPGRAAVLRQAGELGVEKSVNSRVQSWLAGLSRPIQDIILLYTPAEKFSSPTVEKNMETLAEKCFSSRTRCTGV